ncbi:MAG: hypothetical protein DRN01_05190 [Thermoplasmata archaeon]|nr:MAG: hypothetical protein DRN01_05190 [Thermoplasmata archaeon]
MPMVTLVGERMAKKGAEFTYLGPSSECKNCRLKTACFNLKKGRRYRIVGIRDKRHSCNLHDGGVHVVEVNELPIVVSVEKNNAKEGSEIGITTMDCMHLDCDNFELCHNPAVQVNKKYRVVKLLEKIECMDGRDLVKAEVSGI